MKLTYGSLFSGVGGMDMGFDTHMECVFQVEWDKHCQTILRRHWPDVPKWGDVQEVNGAEIPPCDVITFGSPCQDLSVAGKRAGLDGGRSSMFYEAVRIIKEMRDATSSRPTGPLPRIAVWENVPGALSSNRGEDFAAVLQALADIGAVLQEYAVLDAQHFGVPQRRRRVFLVAVFDPAISDICPDPLLPVAEGRPRDFAKGRKKGEDPAGSVAESIDGCSLQLTTGCLTPGAHPGSYNGQDAYNDMLIPFVKPSVEETVEVSGFRKLGHGHYTEDDLASSIKQRDYKEATDIVVVPKTTVYSIREDAKANTFSATETDTALCLNGLVPSPQSHHAQLFIAEPIPFDVGRGDPINDHELVNALTARMGTGGLNGTAVAQPIVFDGTRHDDFRMDTEIVPTLKQRMGTGGGQVPMLAEPVTVFQPGTMIRLGGGVSEDIVPTLRAEAKRGDNEPHIAQPLSFDSTFGGQSAVNEDIAPPVKVGSGVGIASPPAVAVPSGITYAVRRLTPLECERLMGYPDDHTRWTDENKEQADTHRYKQCGNGVATPVARWIAQHLKELMWKTSTTTDTNG